MAELRNLSYLVLGISDFDAWETFATDVLGMQVGKRTSDVMSLRMDDHAYRVILERDPADDISAAGWQLDNKDDLTSYIHRLKSLGVDVRHADKELRERRHVSDLYFCEDPDGLTHEFFYGPAMANGSDPFRSKGILSGFRTGAYGLGHVLLWRKNYAESVKFFTEILCLGLSGYMRPEGFFEVTFLHADCHCFHSLALAEAPGEKRLAHIGLEVHDFNDVGLALDRAQKANVPIAATLGCHPNAKCISFYMRSPSGFETEIGAGEINIDKDNWQAETFLEFSAWGHHRTQGLGL